MKYFYTHVKTTVDEKVKVTEEASIFSLKENAMTKNTYH